MRSIVTRSRALGGLVVFALVVTPAGAQWTRDADANLPLGDRAGPQVQPLIRATADGGAYVSWFDNSTGGYDVYLQRLDAAGREQWPHDGVLVADRSFSSTQAYGLAVDANGDALLTFRDDRSGTVQITATRVTRGATFPWGAAGVPLTSGSDFVAAPKITATTDGHAVVAWTNEDEVHLQKLDADGVPRWKGGVTIADASGNGYSLSDLHASETGGVVVALVRGFFGAQLHAQKLSENGEPQWGDTPVVVFDGPLQIANFPTFVPDGSGGAVFGWYGVSPLQCYAQRVLAGGTEAFPHNGVAGSTVASRIRVSPSVGFDAVREEIFLFWTEQNLGQSAWGVYGQKLSSAGVRQWSDAGRVIVPVGATEHTQVRTLPTGGGATVLFVDKPSPPFGQRVLASRVDDAGNFVWTPTIVEASSRVAGKSRLDAVLGPTGVALLAWSDARTDDGDIYAQNVNPDGTLGGRIGFDDPQEFPAAGEALLHDVGNLDTTVAGPAEPTEDVVVVIPGDDPKMPGAVQVFLNQGTDESGAWLGLVANPPIPTGRVPSGVAVGLFDADDFLDFAVSNAADDNVFVYINDGNGQGTFLPPVIVPVGSEPRAIAAADFDEDLDVDLVVANAADQTLFVLANDGTGGFSLLLTIPGGMGMSRVLPDDLDEDKDFDMVFSNSGDGTLGVVFLEGGNVQSIQTLDVGLLPLDIATGDVDGNGFRDLASANNGDGTVSVILNDGGGVFQTQVPVPVGSEPRSVDAADLDGDLDPDLVVVAIDEAIGRAVQVLENQADGGGGVEFDVPIGFGVDADPNFVATADVNDDAFADIVTSNTDDGETGGSVSVLLNAPGETPCFGDLDGNGSVGFSDLLAVLAAWGPCGSCPEDLDADGDVDFADLLLVLSAWGPC